MDNLATMTKLELRAACKDHGIKGYGNMNNDGMRAALTAQQAESDAEDAEIIARNDDAEYVAECGFANCPACNIHFSNGLMNVEDVRESAGIKGVREMTHEWECMGCGHNFGKELNHTAPVTRAAPVTSSLKIEQNRPRQNGVTRPSEGGKCRAIWDTLDAYVADPDNEGAMPTAAIIKTIAAEEGWDKTTTMIQFYQWRKFNGISGRSK